MQLWLKHQMETMMLQFFKGVDRSVAVATMIFVVAVTSCATLMITIPQ